MSDQQQMTDHWWWRPGWSIGRRFYTWHVTFQHASDVRRLAHAYRQGLTGVDGLDLVPEYELASGEGASLRPTRCGIPAGSRWNLPPAPRQGCLRVGGRRSRLL
ncbi:hypothetical protein AB0B89_10595 [Sphaerisporangium sp. NPDC049002]|uniref:hypothetical protein n=1 Tax=Sphaerisporangium sp. NPDC049002 TaxID=3155392 RepID=UPI0034018755